MHAEKKIPTKRTVLPKGLYGITSRDFGMTHVQSAMALLGGGAKLIQYREKSAGTGAMIEEAREIGLLCKAENAIFIVNDSVEVAMAVGADGVHVGHEDMPVKEARRSLPNKIIGASAASAEEAVRAERDGADYIGAAAIFHSLRSKPDARVIGLEELKRIRDSVKIPVYAIGGIRMEHLKTLKQYGIDGFTVISTILASEDPEAVAKEFINGWLRA
ncbi:MAG: thiamine phosphate synthase [Candidatus Micrarchaeota archaeon]|nr:thiamine phosphate synthase [Candidatus Micrarchaeota archaeon]